MRFKGFTFPYNPRTCRYSASRTYANHKYPELRGAELEDMGVDAVVITGEGEFSGGNAYYYWTLLSNLFIEQSVGDFYHPIYTNVPQALMTKLECNLEPRDDYVSYSFEFVSHGEVKQAYASISNSPSLIYNSTSSNIVKSKSKNDTSDITIVGGDTVVCNGYAYYDSYGSYPHSSLLVNKLMTVTHVNANGSHPICVGSIGWMALSDIQLGNTYAVPSSAGHTVYIVKAGDTLWDIAKKFSTTWKDIAYLNNMKDPNILHVGDILKIPA